MQNRNDELFTSAPIPRAFATLCLPVILGMLVNLLYNMADTYFVGQLGDPNQMAAVSLCSPVFVILMGLSNIFSMGGSSVISRLMGAKQHERVRSASAMCFWCSAALGAVVGAILLVGMQRILPILGASENTMDYARAYLVWIIGGAPLILISFTLINILRCDGAARQAMTGSVMGSVVNIALDPLFIQVLHMGVRGAAIATIAGYLVNCVYFMHYVLRKSETLSIAPRHVRFEKKILLDVLGIGTPASVSNILSSVSSIVLNNMLLPFGDASIAAMGIAIKANYIVALTQEGFAAGLPPIIGYNYGARNFKRLKQVLKAAFTFIILLGTALSVFVYALAPNIIRMFMDVQEIVGPGTQMLRALVLCGPFLGALFIMNSFFQAAGKVLPAMLLSLCRQGIVFLAALTVLHALLGWNGIVYAQTAADYITLFIAVTLFAYTGRRALRDGDEQLNA